MRVTNFYRYESPCGVMSWQRSGDAVDSPWLRIPMRGYEMMLNMARSMEKELRIPMRGYERSRSMS